MKRNRSSQNSKPKKIFIVLCEGEKTEPKYFSGIFRSKLSNRESYTFKIYKPTDHSPLGLVHAAKKEKTDALRSGISAKDIITWAVFDRDQHAKIPEAHNMARDNNIFIAFSSICFEFWILLHYSSTTRPFSSCVEVEEFIRQNHDANYNSIDNLYEHLKDRIGSAITNAKAVRDSHSRDLENGKKTYELNPYTDVDYLVTVLLNLPIAT